MKQLILSIISLLIISTGCSNGSSSPIAKMQDADTAKYNVENDTDSNAYIDVNVLCISDILTKPNSRSKLIKEEDMAQVKAAIYRFYKHVSIKDGYYVCDLTDGSAINVSQDIYLAFMDNLREMNDYIKSEREQGRDVVLSVPDEKYLNSLLK